MHIEINAGGLDGAIAFAEYQSNMSDYISNAEDVISSFKSISSSTYALNGGVGNLSDAVGYISTRIRTEESKKEAAVQIQKKSNDFVDLAIRVDQQVAELVDQNKDEFYRVNPWLKPAGEDDTPWYEKAWDWLCDHGRDIKEGVEKAWNWISDTAVKIWDGLVEFYQEHKKIIDTILIIVGAVVAIAAVIASGGLALVPLLGALGLSTGAAIAISTAVAVTAVVSTIASGLLNIADIWLEIDNPVFNFFQKALNIISTVSNLTYSIGNLYNSIKHITPEEYVSQNPVKTIDNAVIAEDNTLTFDNNVEIAQDPISDERYFVKGDHYGEYEEYWMNEGDYSYVPNETPQIEYVNSDDIEGVWLSDNEVKNPDMFWDKRYSRQEYMDYINNGGMDTDPVEVVKLDDYYCFSGEGRHRIISAKNIHKIIKVIIKGNYIKK